MKYRYNKISNMRSFAETPAKKFRKDGKTIVKRKELEYEQYNILEKWIKSGRIESVQEIK